MRYSTGDRVRVVAHLQEGDGFGVYVNPAMVPLRGKICTISQVNDNSYHLKESSRVHQDYYWTEDMFEPAYEYPFAKYLESHFLLRRRNAHTG